MADPTYDVKVYMKQGGDQMVVASGGAIKIETGGSIVPDSGTKAAAIAALGTASGTFTAGERAKLNLLIAAVTNVGILATG